ncbi:hypothetical protein GCK32_008711 [Trichostrongylus colubriformis]|uniref:Uncharacterized protein n=1 Tax=Trichostrongylus colubriformis TaxID=6319 RepID=A0AAN8FUW1_TRICO
MWLPSMLLLLLLAVSPSGSWDYRQDELEGVKCQPFRRKIGPDEVHCIRGRGRKSRGHNYVCSPTFQKGYAKKSRLQDGCFKRLNDWYECRCKTSWSVCSQNFLKHLRKFPRDKCQKELVDELRKKITTTTRSTKKPTTTSTTTTTTTMTTTTTTRTSTTTTTARPTTTTTTTTTTTRTTPSTTTTTKSTLRTAEYEPTTTQTWPIIVHTSGAVEVTGTTSEYSTTASRLTNGTDMTAEELSPYRAAKIEARMLRNIHRQQYEQYVQNCLKELRAKETTSSEDSKRSSTSAPKSIEKHSGGFFTKIKKTAESTMVTSQMLKSQLPTLQRRISQAPALDDETVTDFYTSGNVKKK